MAEEIASKSPIPIVGTKQTLIYSMSHSVDDSLNQIATLNAALLQSDDLPIAAAAAMSKTKGDYAKL